MITYAKIEKFHGNKEPLTFNLEKVPYILTGDNGSGKTTILNTIYNALVGEFKWFLKLSFESCNISFVENSYALESMHIEKYEFSKEFNILDILYSFKEKKLKIRFMEEIPYNRFSFELVDANDVLDSKGLALILESPFYFSSDIDNIKDFIEEHPEFDFMNSIKKSLLYFPTYRRIDIDLANYFENVLTNQYEFRHFNSNKINFSKNLSYKDDRRVIGVGNQGIEEIYKSYSEDLNKFNSEGLEKLLNSFVKKVIESVTQVTKKDESYKVEFPTISEVDESAPDSLIELANLLNIQVEEEQIMNYYSEKNEIIGKIQKGNEKVEKNNNKNKKASKEKASDDDLNLLKYIFSYSSKGNNLVDELSKMYLSFKKSQSDFLIPFTFLKESIELFFKGKITLEINSDNKIMLLKEGSTVDFTSLSTGEKQILTLLSYTGLEIRKNDFDPLILIDEPELSLHIRWQKLLLKQLSKKDKARIIVATHSPYIATMNYSNNTYKLGEVDE